MTLRNYSNSLSKGRFSKNFNIHLLIQQEEIGKETIGQNQFNLLVYGRDRPFFKQKQKKLILQNFDLLAFFKKVYSMFLLFSVFRQNL